MSDTRKSQLIQDICELSEEDPVYLCNYSEEELEEYADHLQSQLEHA